MMKGRHLRVGLLCMSILVERIQLIEIHAGQCGHEGHGHYGHEPFLVIKQIHSLLSVFSSSSWS